MSDAIYWPCADALMLAAQLSSAPHLPPPSDLRQRITDVLDRMVAAGRKSGISEADLAEARFALVAFMDEQILKSSWPGRAEWMNQPLQLVFYRTTTAGEMFFARMRALLNEGGRHVPLQIYYLCLALGFRGAYGESGQGGALASFADAAQKQLAPELPSASKISPHALPPDRAEAEKKSRAPLIAVIAGCALVTVLMLGILSWSLHSSVDEVERSLPTKAPSAAHSG
jgi:type VI secretion system protein ImpK